MAVVLRCGIGAFRTLNDPLSGEVHVSGGYSRARGARKRGGRAKARSLEPGAGPDDGSGTTAGGSARTSDAPPAGRETSGGSADGGGNETKRAPNENLQLVMRLEFSDGEWRPVEPLPETRLQFVDAVNALVRIVRVGGALLSDKDVKVRQRAYEHIVDLAFAKNSRAGDEERPRKISWNLPRPERD
jgi:hypothetical protein